MLYWLIFGSLACALDVSCKPMPRTMGPFTEAECSSRAIAIMQRDPKIYAGCFEFPALS